MNTALDAFTQRVRCHLLHIDRASQGFTMCVDCRRPLFPAPKNKCRDHWTYCCWTCFTPQEIAEFAYERNGASYGMSYTVDEKE